MKQLSSSKKVIIVILSMLIASSAFAQHKWAPIIKKQKGYDGMEGGTSSFWLSFGPSIAKWHPWGNDYDELTMVGVGIEMAIRPIKKVMGTNLQWAIDVPFVVTVHQYEFKLKGFMISGQFIPTARLIIKTEPGIVFSPYIGFGGGVVIYPSDYYYIYDYNNRFDAVFSIRLGNDIMFTKMLGVRLDYTRSFVKHKHFNKASFFIDDESVNFNQLNLSLVFHP